MRGIRPVYRRLAGTDLLTLEIDDKPRVRSRRVGLALIRTRRSFKNRSRIVGIVEPGRESFKERSRIVEGRR